VKFNVTNTGPFPQCLTPSLETLLVCNSCWPRYAIGDCCCAHRVCTHDRPVWLGPLIDLDHCPFCLVPVQVKCSWAWSRPWFGNGSGKWDIGLYGAWYSWWSSKIVVAGMASIVRMMFVLLPCKMSELHKVFRMCMFVGVCQLVFKVFNDNVCGNHDQFIGWWILHH
jgi:hypothetical protein